MRLCPFRQDDAGVATADIAASGAWQSTEYMEAYLSDRNADNRANRALGAVNAKVAALRGESPLDVKVQMAKNANLVNALMADSARAVGMPEPALFTCKRGPDGTITSEPAVMGSAGIEPAPTNSAIPNGLFVADSIRPRQVVKWARPELNRRSSPCEGDVITPRPRAPR